MRNMNQQKGAVILTVAFALLFLLGFMGIALDFGHLFVVKTELQTATDSCALAAAQELDGGSDALTRATNAGKTAGNLNKVNFQGAAAGIGDADITFSDSLIGSYSHTFTPVANAKYAKCTHAKAGMAPWLLQAMGAFSGNAAYGANQSVGAVAVATRASGQSACPIPIGLRPKGGPPNYGYVIGEWVTVKGNTGSGPGQAGWFSLDPANPGSSSLVNQMRNSVCGIKVTDPLGTEVTGAKNNLEVAWNSRFGIYKKIGDATDGISAQEPDYTGYAYNSINWPNAKDAYDGIPTSDPSGTAENFKIKRSKFASYDSTGTSLLNADDPPGPPKNGIYNLKPGVNTGGFKDLAPPGDVVGGHKQFGTSRRIVLVPVIPQTGAGKVDDFACMLMLQPMVQPTDDVKMEFRGNAGAANSPCTTNGYAGGSNGPLVPVLVQ